MIEPALPPSRTTSPNAGGSNRRADWALVLAGLALILALGAHLPHAIAQPDAGGGLVRGEAVMVTFDGLNRGLLAATGDSTSLTLVSPDRTRILALSVSDAGINISGTVNGQPTLALTSTGDFASLTLGDQATEDLVGVYASEGRGLARVEDRGAATFGALAPVTPINER